MEKRLKTLLGGMIRMIQKLAPHKDGKIKDTRQVNNLVVTTGLNFITSRINFKTSIQKEIRKIII